jgi:hypothetical protein
MISNTLWRVSGMDTIHHLSQTYKVILKIIGLKLRRLKMKTIKEKKQLIIDYMSKCPFIEFHNIVQLNEETATIDVAFDHDFEEVKDADRSKD